ncbi:MAG: DUF1152 domain-containing protein [Myxococcales bacterium]|nr:DUF1152 domain-containing protein [Myxococcales bacterium]
MTVLDSPLGKRLLSCERILLAGAGGGYDVFCGLPLYFALRHAGKQVSLANLSFTYLGGTDVSFVLPHLARVEGSTRGCDDYFPERYLAELLGVPVWTIEKVGVTPVREAYRHLVRTLDLDAIVLVDGGTDILMRGDEAGLGTPAEDMTSLAAVHGLDVGTKLVTCLGFGIDAFHGVCHAHFLEDVAALVHEGAFLGAQTLLADWPEVERYRKAVAWVHERMQPSIVNASIVSAIEGHFGDHQTTDRTRGSQLFINPLMSLFWGFELDAVARRSLYLRDLEGTQSIWDVQAIIEAFRKGISSKSRATIPV